MLIKKSLAVFFKSAAFSPQIMYHYSKQVLLHALPFTRGLPSQLIAVLAFFITILSTIPLSKLQYNDKTKFIFAKF